MPREFKARYQSTCRVCKQPIDPGQLVVFPTAADKYVVHLDCCGKLPTPPKASSTSSGGPPALSLGNPAPGQVTLETKTEEVAIVWIQVAGWVPSTKTHIVVAAIEEARRA